MALRWSQGAGPDHTWYHNSFLLASDKTVRWASAMLTSPVDIESLQALCAIADDGKHALHA